MRSRLIITLQNVGWRRKVHLIYHQFPVSTKEVPSEMGNLKKNIAICLSRREYLCVTS